MIFKQNRPQHPDVYVHYLKSNLTAYWLNRALGLLHCRGKTHHEPHRSTPATRLPWRRLTLMDSEPGCGRTVPIYVQCVFTLYISHLNIFPSPKTTEQKSWWAAGLEALLRAKFFTYYKIMRAQSHAVLLNGLFFSFFFSFFVAQNIQGVQWGETTALSHIIGPRLEFMYWVFSSECHTKPKAHIQHTIHKQQKKVSQFNHHHHYTNNSTRMKV